MLKKFACGAYLARGPAPSTPGLKNIDDFEGGRAKKRGKKKVFPGGSKWSSTSLLGQASAISRGGKRSSTVPKTKIAALGAELRVPEGRCRNHYRSQQEIDREEVAACSSQRQNSRSCPPKFRRQSELRVGRSLSDFHPKILSHSGLRLRATFAT